MGKEDAMPGWVWGLLGMFASLAIVVTVLVALRMAIRPQAQPQPQASSPVHQQPLAAPQVTTLPPPPAMESEQIEIPDLPPPTGQYVKMIFAKCDNTGYTVDETQAAWDRTWKYFDATSTERDLFDSVMTLYSLRQYFPQLTGYHCLSAIGDEVSAKSSVMITQAVVGSAQVQGAEGTTTVRGAGVHAAQISDVSQVPVKTVAKQVYDAWYAEAMQPYLEAQAAEAEAQAQIRANQQQARDEASARMNAQAEARRAAGEAKATKIANESEEARQRAREFSLRTTGR